MYKSKLAIIFVLSSWSNSINAVTGCLDKGVSTLKPESLPSVIIDIQPKYPIKAAKEGLSGCVVLKFNVEEKGNVSNIKIIKSSTENDFNQSSVEALKKWVFEKQSTQTSEAIIFEYSLEPTPSSKHKFVTFLDDAATIYSSTTSGIEPDLLSEIDKLKRRILKANNKSVLAVENIKHQILLLDYELNELNKINKNSDYETKKHQYTNINKDVIARRASFKPPEKIKELAYTEIFESDNAEQNFLKKYRYSQAKENDEVMKKHLGMRLEKQLAVAKLKVAKGLLQELKPYENSVLEKDKLDTLRAQAEAEAKKKREEKLAQFYNLGDCEIGNSVFHRETWDSTTSSGNVIADGLFNASAKESFIITFEAIVEGFVGSKVKTIINDYRVEQTIGGGILEQKTYRKYDLAKYADKYIGRVQFYDKSRCSQ